MEKTEKDIKIPVSGPGPYNPIYLLVEINNIKSALQTIKQKCHPVLKTWIDNEMFILSDCIQELEKIVKKYEKDSNGTK